MHYACANGDIRAVKMLLSCGADPNLQNYAGETP